MKFVQIQVTSPAITHTPNGPAFTHMRIFGLTSNGRIFHKIIPPGNEITKWEELQTPTALIDDDYCYSDAVKANKEARILRAMDENSSGAVDARATIEAIKRQEQYDKN